MSVVKRTSLRQTFFLVEGDDEETQDGPTLRQVARACCKPLDIGTAVMPKPLFQASALEHGDDLDGPLLEDGEEGIQTQYARVVANEFNAIVVEHHLKWAPLCVSEPGPLPNGTPCDRLGRYDFDQVDKMVDWALEHNLKVKGHVLVWAVTSPAFLQDMEAHQVREHLRRHIFTTMGHFRSRIKVWDVVNEPLAPDGSLAENVFLQKLGPSYIEDAFRWAHEADPKAILLLNENKAESIDSVKGQKLFDLLGGLKARGVPIHGCGLQAHFNAAGTGSKRPPTPRQVKAQIRRIGDLGLSVNISEMDVRVSQLPANVQQLAQRQIYHDIIAAAVSEPAFDGVWLWGFTDRHTWVSSFYYDDEPLVFDEEYGRKEAYYGLRDAIASLSPGRKVGGDGVLLESDVDVNGHPWGHLWMQPEPLLSESEHVRTGDARPDWEHEKELDSGEGLGMGTEVEDEDEAADIVDDDDDDEDDDEDGLSSAPSSNKELPPIS